jgi:hypothetical protein
MPVRRLALALTLAAGAGAALAHHGIVSYDTSRTVTVTGFVAKPMDGFPHYEITVRSEGRDWTVDMGNGHVLERAGFRRDGSEFTTGRRITVEGYRVTDPDWYHLAPRVITLEGEAPRGIDVGVG